ncbi:MAG: hypothetical protein OXM55_08190 [Bdellovibrionales bacterium]|nr:hypothetical protein [Bdellovibrionales bacterium]
MKTWKRFKEETFDLTKTKLPYVILLVSDGLHNTHKRRTIWFFSDFDEHAFTVSEQIREVNRASATHLYFEGILCLKNE